MNKEAPAGYHVGRIGGGVVGIWGSGGVLVGMIAGHRGDWHGLLRPMIEGVRVNGWEGDGVKMAGTRRPDLVRAMIAAYERGSRDGAAAND